MVCGYDVSPGSAADLLTALTRLADITLSAPKSGELLIESIPGRASANQYGYAVRDVRNCESLAGQLPRDAGIKGHDAFMARLRQEHSRKSRFWELVREGA